MDGHVCELKLGQAEFNPESKPGQPELKPDRPEPKSNQPELKSIQAEPKPGQPEPLSDSIVPNGCIVRRHSSLEDDCDAERVGVLDYMPQSRNIELTTFRITECRDRRNPVTTQSDDDELLGAENEDFLHEVVVQSSEISHASSPCDRETSPFPRCVPSSFGATLDGARVRPDLGRGSPPDEDGEAVERELVEDTFTTFRVSARDGGCGAMTAVDVRDDEAIEDLSLQHDSATSLVDETDPEAQTTVGPANGLPPVEVVSVDRSPMDPGSLSRSNVLYLNDYSLWTNAARAFCRDEPATADRSEVEKRQERRDKRRERRAHERTVKAEEIEGYMGMKEVMDLVEYIQGEAGRKEVGKTRKGKELEIGVGSHVHGEQPAKLSQRHKTLKKATSLKLPDTVDVCEAGVGTGKVSMERSRSEDYADEGCAPDQPDLSGLVEMEWIPGASWSSNSKAVGRTSMRSDFQSSEPEESIRESVSSHLGKAASKSDEPEQIPGSKKSKKQNSKKNRGTQVSDPAQRGSQTNIELSSTTAQSFSSEEPSGGAFLGSSEGRTVDGTLSESWLLADAAGEDEDAGHLLGYLYKSSSAQEKLQDVDDTWTVHTRRHAKPRAKVGDGENRTGNQGELHPFVWKDQPGRAGYRKPEGRGPFGRVGSVGEGPQGGKFPHLPSGGRVWPGSTSGLDLEGYNSPSKVGSRTFWGSRDWKESLKTSDASRISSRFPNRGSCVEGDDVDGRKEESVTYARITAGEPTYTSAVLVEKITHGQSSRTPDDCTNEVFSQIVDEGDRPPERKSDAPDTGVIIETDGVGAGSDSTLKPGADARGTTVVLAPKNLPGGGTTVASVTTKQVASDAALTVETLSGVGKTLSSSKREDHSRVPGERSDDVSTAKVNVRETESKADLSQEKHNIVLNDRDPSGQGLPKTLVPVSQQNQQRRNTETKAKALPVEFSKRFKGARVDGISFCFDPTAVTDSRSQGSSPSSFSALDSSSTGGGSFPGRLLSGQTTVVPAGGGLQSLGSGGNSVSNCSRPIAPLSGTGHASGARTPVVVVNPMQLVARVPSSAGGSSHTIVGSGDTDPEILKEVTVPMVRIDDQMMVMKSTSPVFPMRTDDGTRADTTTVKPRATIVEEEPQQEEALVLGSPFGHRSQLQADPRSKRDEPPHFYDAPHQQFASPSVYVLYRPCTNCPPPTDVCLGQGATTPVGSPQPEVTPPPLQGLCQPRSVREQQVRRQETHCAVQPQLAVATMPLCYIQNYVHSDFQKVLAEERHDSSRVVRFRVD